MNHGFVLWLTGLSGAGKSTLARCVAAELRRFDTNVEVLDGDTIRENLSKGLGYSKEDRDTNILRIGYVAQLLSRNGVVVVVAAIAPYAETRAQVRAMMDCYVEVYVDCSIEELIRRDVKGLYRRALAGEIEHFTGVSDPYEPPIDPEVHVNSEVQSEQESTAIIMRYLKQRDLTPE